MLHRCKISTMQTGPFQGSNPVLGTGSVDMAHPGNDSNCHSSKESIDVI